MRSYRGRPSASRLVALALLALAAGALALAGRGGPLPVAAQPGAINVTFSAAPTTVRAGEAVLFNYSASPPAVTPPQPSVQVLIAFGDGSSFGPVGQGSGETVIGLTTHTYSTPGAYVAVLQATASNGQSTTRSITITVLGSQCGPPIVQLNHAPQPATVGQPVTFTYAAQAGSGCTQQDAPIGSLLISFGDGSSPLPLNSISGIISHTYNAPGTFTAVVTARSGEQLGQATNTVQVVGQCGPPSVTLSATPQQIQAGQSVTFSYSAVAGAGCTQQTAPLPTLVINFGDGSQPEQLGPLNGTVSHVYPIAGTFTATLTATSAAQSGSASATVVVNPAQTCAPPVVNLSSQPNPAVAGQTVTIFYTAVAGAGCTMQNAPVGSLLINFGDGTSPLPLNNTDGNIQRVYNAPGSYTVTVTARSGEQIGQATIQIQVGGAPTPTPTPTPGITVAAAAGWNLVGGPTGTVITGSSGPLYTFGTGDTAYQVVAAGTPLTAGRGYWAYFPTATNYTVPFTGAQTFTVQAPAGRYFMVGNPGNTPATVSGADIVYTYNAAAGNYVAATTIPVGGGAWVLSLGGGTITVTSPAR